MHQYRLMGKALRLKQIDEDRNMHWLAYNIFRAQAKKQRGKKEVPVYKTFRSFFDYEAELEKVEKKEKNSMFDELIEHKKQKRKEGENHG